MEKARRFCRDNRNAIIFCSFDSKSNRLPDDAIVIVKGVCFSVRFCSEAPSLIELLEKGGWLNSISKGFSHFGISLNECLKQNKEATIAVMRRCCQRELTKSHSSWGNLYQWRMLLQNLDRNAPGELRSLLKETIKKLEKISSDGSPKKKKIPLCSTLSQSKKETQSTLF